MKVAIFERSRHNKKRRKLYKQWIGSPDGSKERKINHVRLLLHLEEKDKLQELAEKDRDYGVIVPALLEKK